MPAAMNNSGNDNDDDDDDYDDGVVQVYRTYILCRITLIRDTTTRTIINYFKMTTNYGPDAKGREDSTSTFARFVR